MPEISAPSPKSGTLYSVPLKIVAGSAGGLLLALGLCGVGALFRRGSGAQGVGAVAMFGFGLSILSLLGLAVGVLALLIVGVVSLFRR